MRRKKMLNLILLWLIPLAFFFPLQWAVARARSQRLSEAVYNWKVKEAVALEQAGVQTDLATDLRLQIQKGNSVAVKTLITQGADVNFQTEQWSSPLFYAAARGSVPIVKTLIKHGADVNLRDDVEYHKTNALITAATYKHADVVKVLIEHGADVNVKTDCGNTALDAARDPEFGNGYENQVRTIQILKAVGATAATSRPLPFERQSKPK